MLISWNTTKRCNLFCRHCYREAGPQETTADELTTAEGRQLIKDIKKAGFHLLILSGGEPLLAFGLRIFQNLAIIRRYFLKKY